ncbi:MAG TPA: transglycosylase SLT domain-containing protein [Dokdonella sp.]|uniref:transglycosylase SLT domain-containing protein n=1 Tax=Dokdonella sp. TaxID=2291710 RepID=UPI0025BC11F5|nr:transglycosylase SLT domain-containing protein [Dokdonella sp.]MBX3692957.1 transglycosylase SLT domain-containing protein [Dokdonella sp.]MCW5568214.1 transglycosylase SLT domain-containing protein [Dokdonella sp.]HNR91318.1 transglycosylase SLT domain-containing protein [Dokdonella sp.]
MSSVLRCLPIALGLLLAACATAPAKTSGRPTPGNKGKVDEIALNRLYGEFDAASQRHLSALDLAAHGEVERARVELNGALDELQAAAVRCTTLPGCDGARFFSTYDRLLRAGLETPDDVDGEEPVVVGDEGGVAGSPLVAALPAMDRTITLLNGRELADILVLNEPVKAGIEQWLTQYRPNLVTAYVNYQIMRYRMWPEYHKVGLPEALLFGILAKESGGRVHAVSRAGASGPLQFMYATGLRFGLTRRDGFDQRFDPGLSARANAAYINEQLAIFNGNLELVIAAYNGGEGRMQRLAGRGGQKSFWDPDIYAALPAETRDYVPMVLAAAWLFLHPERYNLQFPKVDGRPGSIMLAEPATLAELTVCLGNEGASADGWFRALRNLNPALDPAERQPAGTRIELPAQLEPIYRRSCVEGQWGQLAADLHTASLAVAATTPKATRVATVRGSGTHSYVVRKGDSLAAIARRSGCARIEEIARLNGLRAPRYAIRAGQTLKLPACAAGR